MHVFSCKLCALWVLASVNSRVKNLTIRTWITEKQILIFKPTKTLLPHCCPLFSSEIAHKSLSLSKFIQRLIKYNNMHNYQTAHINRQTDLLLILVRVREETSFLITFLWKWEAILVFATGHWAGRWCTWGDRCIPASHLAASHPLTLICRGTSCLTVTTTTTTTNERCI